MIIGITGLASSGKDTAAEYFQKKGWQIFSCSDILRDEAKIIMMPDTRENLITLATKIKKEQGGDILIKKILTKVKGDAVILGIRHPDEVKLLQKSNDFYLLFIDVDPRVRFSRAQSRGKKNDEITSFDEFLNLENIERKGLSGGQAIDEVINVANYTVDNSKDKTSLWQQIDLIMQKIEGQKK